MKKDRLKLQDSITIETWREYDSRRYIGYSNGVSRYFADADDLRKWLPLKPATQTALESWLASLPD